MSDTGERGGYFSELIDDPICKIHSYSPQLIREVFIKEMLIITYEGS